MYQRKIRPEPAFDETRFGEIKSLYLQRLLQDSLEFLGGGAKIFITV